MRVFCSWYLRNIVTCGMAVGSNNWKYYLEGKTTRHNFKILTRLKLSAHVCRLCTKKKMARKDRSLRHVVGAQCCAVSIFVHPSPPIRKKYINRTKYHKMELVVLIRDSVKQRCCSGACFFLLASWFWRWWILRCKTIHPCGAKRIRGAPVWCLCSFYETRLSIF